MQRDDGSYPNTEQPSLFWRTASFQTILTVSALSRAFLLGLNKVEVHGLPQFLELLKARADYRTRTRGLLTVSNHVSIIDDPLVWGVLPFSFTATYLHMNHRWTLGSHDLCFKNGLISHFFTLGQTLPTHRLKHSPYGGLAQSTMTESVRILSRIDTKRSAWSPHAAENAIWPSDCVDPFSGVAPAPAFRSYHADSRSYLAPSRYACNSYGWIHIFPEGFVHQSQGKTLRYFKWGVARLILEPVECPVVVPMFVDGTDQIMHESRGFPRFLPRFGKHVSVTFGEAVDTDTRFGDLRERWHKLVQDTHKAEGREWDEELTGLMPAWLLDHPEAVELRRECTRRVRGEVLKVRQSRGYPAADPKSGLVETWAKEGPAREGRMQDGSWVKEE